MVHILREQAVGPLPGILLLAAHPSEPRLEHRNICEDEIERHIKGWNSHSHDCQYATDERCRVERTLTNYHDLVKQADIPKRTGAQEGSNHRERHEETQHMMRKESPPDFTLPRIQCLFEVRQITK